MVVNIITQRLKNTCLVCYQNKGSVRPIWGRKGLLNRLVVCTTKGSSGGSGSKKNLPAIQETWV